MKVLFSGGYTLGPVTPLLAVKEIIQDEYPASEFIWVGTKTGPEKKLIEEEHDQTRQPKKEPAGTKKE